MSAPETRVAFVSGGSRGIGRAISERLARERYHVLVNYRERTAEAEETCAAIAAAGGSAQPVRADVTDEAAVVAAFARAKSDHGRLDVLVNNAGRLHEGALAMTSARAFMETIEANVLGTYLCSKYAARIMVRRKSGCIVNVSSTAATRVPVGLGAYAASKAAVNALTIGLARELAESGIRVNAVAPSYVETDLLRGSHQQGIHRSGGLNRLAAADEVASAVAALVRDDFSYVLGTVLVVDGGRAG